MIDDIPTLAIDLNQLLGLLWNIQFAKTEPVLALSLILSEHNVTPDQIRAAIDCCGRDPDLSAAWNQGVRDDLTDLYFGHDRMSCEQILLTGFWEEDDG